MAKIASLDERRAARTQDDVVRCGCGSEWFELAGYDGAAPLVTLATDGRITGYAAAHLTCRSCGSKQ